MDIRDGIRIGYYLDLRGGLLYDRTGQAHGGEQVSDHGRGMNDSIPSARCVPLDVHNAT